jgi:hypothetical protein
MPDEEAQSNWDSTISNDRRRRQTCRLRSAFVRPTIRGDLNQTFRGPRGGDKDVDNSSKEAKFNEIEQSIMITYVC